MATNLSIVVYPGVDYPRAEVETARIALLVSSCLALALSSFFVACHVVSLSSFRFEELMKPNLRWRIYLPASNLMYMVCGILLITMASYDWRGNELACYYVPQFLSFFFVVMKQFAALVLWARAKVVHDGLKLKSAFVRNFRIFMFFGVTIGVLLAFGWSYWINYAGKVVPEGVCIYYSKYPEVILTFGILDAVMNVSLLLLFVIPLTAHTREMAGIKEESKVSNRLKNIIRHNFYASLTIAVFDSLALAAMCIILTIVHGQYVEAHQEYLQIWALFVPILESIAAMVALHSMTLSWMPKRVRVMFKRTEVSFEGNDSSSNKPGAGSTDVSAVALYLGNVHADGKTIETRIRARVYVVSSRTLFSLLAGKSVASRLARSFSEQWIQWKTALVVFLSMQVIFTILILVGVIPTYVSWVVLALTLIPVCLDNIFSIDVVRKLLTRFAPLTRVACALGLMFLMCDVVNWDERCALLVAGFIGTLFGFFVDALIKEARETFAVVLMLFCSLVPLCTLILLQFDLIANRNNTILTFQTVGTFEYSVYHAARDAAFLVCVLVMLDAVHVMRGSARKCFIYLDGDIAVRVVGLAGSKKPNTVVNHEEDKAPANHSEPDNNSSVKSLGRNNAEQENMEAGSAPGVAEDAKQNKYVERIDLREQDSLVVRMAGISRGAGILKIYTEPWFRLVNEYLLGVPLALFTACILPGFIDPNYSYLMFLSLLPFARNFGLKSSKLLFLLMFRMDFLFEMIVIITSLAFLAGSFLDPAKRTLIMYLFCFWLDVRTNDARCVFFHTGTRRGRKLSPVERIVFRFASFLIAISFVALPIVLLIGISANTNFSSGFKLQQNNIPYPQSLDMIFYYQTGVDAVLLVVWKLILDVYMDMYYRGRGVRFRYLRAPIQPQFGDSAASSGLILPTTTSDGDNERTKDNAVIVDAFSPAYHQSLDHQQRAEVVAVVSSSQHNEEEGSNAPSAEEAGPPREE